MPEMRLRPPLCQADWHADVRFVVIVTKGLTAERGPTKPICALYASARNLDGLPVVTTHLYCHWILNLVWRSGQ